MEPQVELFIICGNSHCVLYYQHFYMYVGLREILLEAPSKKHKKFLWERERLEFQSPNLLSLIHLKSEVLIWSKVNDTVGSGWIFHCDTGKGLNLFFLYDMVSLDFIYLFLIYIWAFLFSVSNHHISFAVVKLLQNFRVWRPKFYFLFALHDHWWSALTLVYVACTLIFGGSAVIWNIASVYGRRKKNIVHWLLQLLLRNVAHHLWSCFIILSMPDGQAWLKWCGEI